MADSILSFITHLDVEDILKEHPDYEDELAQKQTWVSDKDMTDEGPVSYRDYVRLRMPLRQRTTPPARSCCHWSCHHFFADVGCELPRWR